MNRRLGVVAAVTCLVVGFSSLVPVHAQEGQRIAYDLTTMYDAVNPGIVKIHADSGHGSGFLVREDGVFVTNHHVVRNARYLAVEFSDGRKVSADIVMLDAKHDLAVLKVNRTTVTGLRPLSLLPADLDSSVRAGIPVVAFGSPLGQTFLMTQGIVSKVEDGSLLGDFLIQPGNSGGPLVNMAGQVVGVNTFGSGRTSGAVRIGLLRERLVERIQKSTVFDCLGVEISVSGRTLVLSEGRWFEVAESFAKRVNDHVASLAEPSVLLPLWDGTARESEFNDAAADAIEGILCDARLIGFGGGHSTFEFCDILHLPSKTLYFAKIASRSSGMSHLLEQVRRTAELFFGTDGGYRPKVAGALLKADSKCDVAWLDEKPKRDDWTLCLVSMGRGATGLPFFAKAGLYRLVTGLENAGYRVCFQHV